MAYFSLAASRGDSLPEASDHNSARPRSDALAHRGFFRRFLDAVIVVRQQQADREIARFMEARGGKLTDEAEREIVSRFLPRSPNDLRA